MVEKFSCAAFRDASVDQRVEKRFVDSSLPCFLFDGSRCRLKGFGTPLLWPSDALNKRTVIERSAHFRAGFRYSAFKDATVFQGENCRVQVGLFLPRSG